MSRARVRARVARGGLLAVLVTAQAACEPSGPGALDASVQVPVATGAVVVEFRGERITGFEGVGDVRAFSGPVRPGASVHRVVVVAPSGRRLRFRVGVEDVAEPPPTAEVVAAVDLSNRPIESVLGYSLRISR